MNGKLIGIIVFLLLAVGGYFLLTQNKDAPADAPADGQVTIHTSDDQAASGDVANNKPADNTPAYQPPSSEEERKAAQERALAALPPNDLPLNETFEQLKELAQSGNRNASCRLVEELTECFNAESQAAGLRIMERSLTSQENPPDHLFKAVSSTQERLKQFEKRCGGLETEQLQQSYDMQRLAAEQGIPALQIRYLNQPMLIRQRFLNDIEGWMDYKEKAPRIAEQLLRQGYPQAAIWLARTHMPDRQIQDNLAFSMPDKDKAALYVALAHKLYDQAGMPRKGLPDYPQGMTDTEIANAESRAEGMQTSYFRNWEMGDKNQRHKISYPQLNCRNL